MLIRTGTKVRREAGSHGWRKPLPGHYPSTGQSLTYRARISGKKEEKRVDNFRKEVIRELEKKLGDDHKIFPQDRTKNNGFTAHGVCIRKKSENIGAVAYIDETLLMYASGAAPSLLPHLQPVP